MRLLCWTLPAMLVCASATAFAAPPNAPSTKADPERTLTHVLEAVEAHRLDLALERVDELIARYPNFRLAHLIRGDLLSARARPIATFGDVSKAVPREKVDDLRAEALARLKAVRNRPSSEHLPRYVLQLSADQRHAFVVDSRQSRLYVYANEATRDGTRPVLIGDYYVTLGKRGTEKTREGDQKTPLGVYRVVANLPKSKLSDFYGSGAFPINYPNEWDRRLGRNGYGIWLHGTPSDTYSRPPRASDGCIVLSNSDIDALGRYVQVGTTPVIISDAIEWSEPATVEADRKSLADAVESWRADWESLDVERYLRHYSVRFRSPTQDLAAWSEHKRAVGASRNWIKVGTSHLAMLRYPGEKDVVVVTFRQTYRSTALSNDMRKQQYWVREGEGWKILYEGPA